MFFKRANRGSIVTVRVHGKKDQFFEFPYWEHNTLRHNVDVIHIEKTICDSLLGILFDVTWKSYDHVNSRYDLQEMGIGKKLQPIKDANGKVHLDKASFSMKLEEKKLFCTVHKNAKLLKVLFQIYQYVWMWMRWKYQVTRAMMLIS